MSEEINDPQLTIDVLRKANVLLMEQRSRRDTKIAALEAEVGDLRKDKERLDWLNERKSHCYAHWAEGGEWVNPSVIWKVIHFEIEGTYKFSDMLKNMTVRAAIDAALNSTKGGK